MYNAIFCPRCGGGERQGEHIRLSSKKSYRCNHCMTEFTITKEGAKLERWPIVDNSFDTKEEKDGDR